MSTTKRPAPGWYADPARPKTKRYWDGDAWTEQRQEDPPAAPLENSKVVMAFAAALLAPVVGFVVGALWWPRARSTAVLLIVLSVASTLMWWNRLAG